MLHGAEKLLHVDARLRAFAELAGKVLPFDVEVHAGRRTAAEQTRLYAKGRTTVGENPTSANPLGTPVTNAATADDSAHGRGMAIDLVPRVNGKLTWARLDYFEAIGNLAESSGLEWGGRWSSFYDGPHVQIPGWRQALYAVADAVADNKGSISFILLVALAVLAILVTGASWR